MKLDVTPLRYLSREDFAVLSAIEMGSRNHEVVPLRLVSQLSKMRPGGLNRAISELQKLKLVSKDKSSYEGVVLGYGGYDYLALRTLSGRETVAGIGRQIGVGKESDIYEVFARDTEHPCVIKIQRLGRTSFRTVKNNRDYIGKRQHYSWLYLSKLAASKEYAFMCALHQHGFPVPRPVDHSRHIVVMQQIVGKRLDELRIDDVPGDTDEAKAQFLTAKRQECLDLVVRLAQHGLVHGDFNEFNLIVEEASLRIVMIDFPQMVSTGHQNAQELFARDFDCVCGFFERRFGLVSLPAPDLQGIAKTIDLGQQLRASGSKLHNAETDTESYQSDDCIESPEGE
jgi:RIO kinase 2